VPTAGQASSAAPQTLEVALARLEERVASSNDKIDDLKNTITTHNTANDVRLQKVEDRVAVLEAWRWKVVGIALGLSAMASAVTAVVTQHLK
jgi:uncharacterized coiled-coil protein SlyX